MNRRKIRPEELELWQQVARTTEKIGNQDRFAPVADVAPTEPKPAAPLPAPSPLPKFALGQKKRPERPLTASLPLGVSEKLAREPVQMDNKAFGRLKRGKLAPEARMDLHGMTLDQAHPALTRFIATSLARNLRLVLVITGKGQRDDPHDPMPMRRGVLKRQVPLWLKMPPIGHGVLQVSEAHIKHGGGGAYYVYLRRQR